MMKVLMSFEEPALYFGNANPQGDAGVFYCCQGNGCCWGLTLCCNGI